MDNQDTIHETTLTTMQTTVTLITPQRSNSLDYLNFEEKRQLIASSLSLSDLLHCGPAAAAAAAAKEVAANTVNGEYQLYCVDGINLGENQIGLFHLLLITRKFWKLNWLNAIYHNC